ncbi:LOW QUALITY PROTEIN: E3 ubiquitin-protein ligase RNF168-like [Dugong dugon]
MAVPKDAIPSLSECQCQICLEILIEPVTFPCNHTICNPCLQSIIEKANLCCPFCRRWISSWARYHTRKNSLVNMELWEIIQKYYPKECELRASGQESVEIVDDHQPVRLLSMPGELGKEYEEEIRKMETERRVRQEAENKASEEYTQRLLAEEEKRPAEKRQREMEEQLKNDEELAGKLRVNSNNFCERNILASPLNSRRSDSVTIKAQKKRQNRQKNTGCIQKYLSPKSQFGSTSKSEVGQENRKSTMSKEINSTYLTSTMWQDTELEEDTPTLSPQICLEIEEQGAKSSVELPMPQFSACGSKRCFEGQVKPRPNNHGKELRVVNHKEPKTRVPYFREAAVKPCGETESGLGIFGMTQITGNSMMVKENEETNLLISSNTFKRKNEASTSTTVRDLCFSAKRREIFPVASPDKEETEINFTQKQMESEHLLFEKRKQEEQDRLLAFQFQKEMDKEPMKITRQKGSPGKYQLFTTSFSPDTFLMGQKNSQDSNFKKQNGMELSKCWGSLRDENQQPSFKIQLKHSATGNARRVPNSTRHGCDVPTSAHCPQPSNSENSFQMFQRYRK